MRWNGWATLPLSTRLASRGDEQSDGLAGSDRSDSVDASLVDDEGSLVSHAGLDGIEGSGSICRPSSRMEQQESLAICSQTLSQRNSLE